MVKAPCSAKSPRNPENSYSLSNWITLFGTHD
uniref:Uncharacterized protein n=1 Tax=Rhizophora mucronata TaxID=61149 RepID=A0A2P2PCR0_RHIMU